MTAPSIKEALKPCPFCGGEAESDSQRHYRNISTGNLEKSAAIYCTKCSADMTWCYRDTPEIEREQAMVLLTEQWNTRATFQPDGERREAIARIIRGVYGVGCGTFAGGHQDKSIERAADKILASGFAQNEAGILKAMEQECWTLRCVDIPTGGGDADVGWEVIQHHQAKPYERMIAHGRTPQEALTAASAPPATEGET